MGILPLTAPIAIKNALACAAPFGNDGPREKLFHRVQRFERRLQRGVRQTPRSRAVTGGGRVRRQRRSSWPDWLRERSRNRMPLS
jgi:hypothetical protein